MITRRLLLGATAALAKTTSGALAQDKMYIPLISTGTPPSVGMGQKPSVYLKGGEVMRLAIEGLGAQTQRVLGAS